MVVRTLAPLARALTPVHGSLRLITLRWSLVVLAGVPALLVTKGVISSQAARSPYLTDPIGRLPLEELVTLLSKIGPAAAATIGVALLIVLLGQMVLLPGAITWLDRVRHGEYPRQVFRSVLAEGTPYLWAMLRISALAVLLAGLGFLVVGQVIDRILLSGTIRGWDSGTLASTLPRLRLLLGLVWLALVGAGAFWCRVIVTLDHRLRVRSAALLVLQAWRRAPFSGPVLYILVTTLTAGVLGAYLGTWRQNPVESSSEALLRTVGWLVLVWLQAYTWHWLIRAAMLRYTSPPLATLRTRPDRPWFLLRRLLRRPLPAHDAP